MYKKLFTVGGSDLAPIFPVVHDLFAHLKKFSIFPTMFPSSHILSRSCNQYPSEFPISTTVASVICSPL